MRGKYVRYLPVLVCLPLQAAAPLGLFEDHGDVGAVLHAGSAEYNASQGSYTVVGSGENMWFAADAFQFVWKKVSGDVTLTADISFIGAGGNPHRKAVLMIRQSLEADSAYADVALHGEGLTSLQARQENGAATHEVQSAMSAPRRLRIAKRGKYFYIWVAGAGEPLHMAGGSIRVPLQDPFYVGIGVCAHDKDAVEKAVFSNVDLTMGAARAGRPQLYSTLETVTVASTDARVVYVAPEGIAAPNWTRDGASLIFNRQGRLERLRVAGGEPEIIDMASAVRCDNNHGVSPDGDLLAFSGEDGIFTVPLAGGAPKQIIKGPGLHWHGWSPDGKTVVYSAESGGRQDIYTVPAAGGQETRLTRSGSLNDGPEFSPDGKYIYFHSDQGGSMQIWRMHSDGGEPEQVTSAEFNNCFPHPSPDGKQLVFLSYPKDVPLVPRDGDVMLRVMSLNDEKIKVLAKLVGGQGTIDSPSWSPDSRRLAFVSYQSIE